MPRIYANQHLESVKWLSWVPDLRLSFGPFWTLVLRFFEPRLALRCVFNPYSRLNSFSNNSSLFSNNYLVDKYSKSLDYPQFCCYLIILFIHMHASLFLTLTNNESQNYLINFNCSTNQN